MTLVYQNISILYPCFEKPTFYPYFQAKNPYDSFLNENECFVLNYYVLIKVR